MGSHWVQQLEKQNTVVTVTEWKLAVLHMFVWFDFISIPQTCTKMNKSSRSSLVLLLLVPLLLFLLLHMH